MSASARELFEQGVQAIKAKDKLKARQFLRESLALDANNHQAWLLYAKTLDDDEKRLKAIERALKIKPDDPTALKMQQAQLEKTGAAPAPAINEYETFTTVRPASGLGALLGTTHLRQWIRFVYVVVIICFTLLGFGSLALYDGKPDNFFYLPMGAFILLITAFGLYEVFKRWNQTVEIYENGLIILKSGKEVDRVLWSALDGMICRETVTTNTIVGIPVSRSTHLNFKLYRDDKMCFYLDTSFKDYREMASAILQQAAPVLINNLLSAIRRGETVYAGGIGISRNGIEKGNQKIEWSNIKHLEETFYGLHAHADNGKGAKFMTSANSKNHHLMTDLINFASDTAKK